MLKVRANQEHLRLNYQRIQSRRLVTVGHCASSRNSLLTCLEIPANNQSESSNSQSANHRWKRHPHGQNKTEDNRRCIKSYVDLCYWE